MSRAPSQAAYVISGYSVRSLGDLPFPLRRFVVEFMQANPQLADGEYARDRCDVVTDEFLEFLDSEGYIDLEEARPRRWANEHVFAYDGGECGHWAARVDEWIIDFTFRQFDQNTEWPFVLVKADR